MALTQLLLLLSHWVVLGLTAADVFVFLQQHPLQACPEQRRHANRLLPPGAVHNDGIQTTKAIALQQRHQSLGGTKAEVDARGVSEENVISKKNKKTITFTLFPPGPFLCPWTQTDEG